MILGLILMTKNIFLFLETVLGELEFILKKISQNYGFYWKMKILGQLNSGNMQKQTGLFFGALRYSSDQLQQSLALQRALMNSLIFI